ncbi:MAG: two-component regulator propeller domain-containing protein [Bacteroidota bacterium]
MSAKSPYYLNRYLPFVFLLTIPFLKSEAQNKVRFEHITTENGLSQNDVNCIFQDSEGFMWFGTHDGLNKYDGHRFTIYRPDSENPHSIKSNLIAALDEDRNGNIWIGTTGKGLARFDKKTEEFVHFQYDATTDSSLSNDYVNALHIDRFNRLWVGTSDGLNLRYLSEDPFKKNAFIRIDVDAKNQGNHLPTYVNCLHEEPNGTLWLGTMNGLYQLMNTREHEQVRVSSSFFTENSINSITQDGSGALILGSKHGLYYQTGEKPYGFSKILDGLHKKICFDNQKNIWSGTDNGLYLLNNSEKQSEPVLKTRFEENVKDPGSLNKNLIKSIYKDRMGIIWIGMNGGGLNKFDPSGKNFTHVKKTIDPKSLTYNKIRAIYEDSHKTLWIGTEGGGLDMLATGKSSTSNTFDHFTRSLNVFTMAEVEIDRRHFLLAGCEKEPFLFIKDITEPSSITQFSSLPGIRGGAFSIIQDTQGFIWIGSYFNGVYRWDPNTELSGHNFFQIGTHNTNLPSKIIRNIFEDTRGNIWLGTGDGLCKLTPEEAHSEKPDFIIYQNDPYDRTTLSHNYILPIYESRNGTLWIGTFGGGLNRLDREKGVFKSYTEKDGLANNVIKAIQEDDNQNLWISTNKGLTRFDPKRETFTNYDINDGLQSHEFQELASVKRANGEMIFGGVNGFNVFFPDEIKDNQQKAKGVLTDFYVLNQMKNCFRSV